jgi:hypothetical protein
MSFFFFFLLNCLGSWNKKIRRWRKKVEKKKTRWSDHRVGEVRAEKPIQWTEQPTGALTSAGQLKVQKGLLAFEWWKVCLQMVKDLFNWWIFHVGKCFWIQREKPCSTLRMHIFFVDFVLVRRKSKSKSVEYLQGCWVCDPAKIIFTSKLCTLLQPH